MKDEAYFNDLIGKDDDEAHFNDLIEEDDEFVPDDDDWKDFNDDDEFDPDDRDDNSCCDCCGCILNDSNAPIMGTVCIGCLGISEDD